METFFEEIKRLLESWSYRLLFDIDRYDDYGCFTIMER